MSVSLVFDAKSHTYFFNRKKLGSSVSKLVNQHWPAFDSIRIASKCGPKAREKWTGDPDASDTDIITAWNQNAKQAAALGTALHAKIEDYFRGSHNHGLDPTIQTWLTSRFSGHWEFEPEVTVSGFVYEGGRRIPGCVDLLAFCDGEAWLFDWKRGKVDNDNGDLDPITGLRGTKYNKYSLQLAFYAAILKQSRGIDVPVQRRVIVKVLENTEPYEIPAADMDAVVPIVAALEQ